MPYPRMRTLIVSLSLGSFLLLLFYLSFSILAPSHHRQATSSFLFPASAIISLADDNSTVFISRPAAFGPALPKLGLEGELIVLEEGQLACDDTPGWDPATALTAPPISSSTKDPLQDDGTDDVLNPPVAAVEGAAEKGSNRADTPHADIESLQQTAEIEGRIVLVQRGGCGFLEKVLWTQRRGGIALIVGDYKRSGIGGGSGGLVTMYAKGDTSNVTIPSLFTSHTTSSLLTTLLPKPRKPSPTAPNPFKYLLPAPAPSASDSAHRPPSSGELNIPSRAPRSPDTSPRDGLWITLTPTFMSTSPFFDTLLVLVVSPLITLTVVYALLLIRSRIRRRRWRAPKSVVERLPVRTYQAIESPPSTSFPPPRSSSLPSPRSHVEKHRPAPIEVAHRWCGSNECVVCLEEYVDGISQVMRLPCGHEFHADCITPWLTTRRRTCPICKGDVVRGAAEGVDERTPLVHGSFEEEREEEEEGLVGLGIGSEEEGFDGRRVRRRGEA